MSAFLLGTFYARKLKFGVLLTQIKSFNSVPELSQSHSLWEVGRGLGVKMSNILFTVALYFNLFAI